MRQMQRQFRTILGFVALAALLVAAVPFVVAAETARPRPVTLAQVAQQMAAPAPTSYRFMMSGSIADAGTGDQVTLMGNGSQVGTDRTDMTLTVGGAGLSGTPPIQLTRVGNDLYVFLSGILSPTGSDQWVLIDGQTSGLAGMMPQVMAMNPLDGAALLAGANASGMTNTQTLADETINGVATTHSRVTMVPGASTSSASPLAGTGVDIPNATVDVFTGKADGLIRRIALTTQAVVDPNGVSQMLGGGPAAGATGVAVTANIAFMMDFTDFNNTGIVINAPANAVPLTDFTGPLPVGGIGGGAGGPGGPRVLPTGVPRR